jgi:hypothetical protein
LIYHGPSLNYQICSVESSLIKPYETRSSGPNSQ